MNEGRGAYSQYVTRANERSRRWGSVKDEEDLVQNYKTELIYSMPLPDTKMGFSCDVLMEGENGSDWSFEVLQGGDKFEDSDEHSITCEDGKILTIYFANAYTLEQEIHIIIKDQNRENKKVLIITPKQ